MLDKTTRLCMYLTFRLILGYMNTLCFLFYLCFLRDSCMSTNVCDFTLFRLDENFLVLVIHEINKRFVVRYRHAVFPLPMFLFPFIFIVIFFVFVFVIHHHTFKSEHLGQQYGRNGRFTNATQKRVGGRLA